MEKEINNKKIKIYTDCANFFLVIERSVFPLSSVLHRGLPSDV
jgi:hypothetical protein